VDETSTKEKRKSKGLRDKIRNTSIQHPFRMTGYLLVLLLIFAFLFCWLGALLESGHPNPLAGCAYLYYRWHALDGLSLLCGYMGVSATIILGLVTLRFSFKVDERELLGRIRKWKIRRIALYDMYEDFVPHEMPFPQAHNYQYLLKVDLETEQSNYEFRVKNVSIGTCKEDLSIEKFLNLKEHEVYLPEVKDTIIRIYFNEFGQAENSFSYFYHLWEYEPLTMEKQCWYRYIKIETEIDDKIWSGEQAPLCYDAIFTLQVKHGTPPKGDENSVDLQLISHEIEISPSVKKGGK